MLFNSIEFLLFLAVFLAVWPLFRSGNNRRWIILVTASFFFYGWWDWRFLFLLTASGLIDYGAALGMVRFPHAKKVLLALSVACNVGALATFKYLDFLIENTNGLLTVFGVDPCIPRVGLILPIGISFYTFQSMSYTIDVFRGKLRPTKNPFHFFAYLSMFPQLVAGPIVRASVLLPQLTAHVRPTEAQRWDGLRLVIFGFFKKVVIADTLAPVVNAAFGATATVDSSLYWWIIMAMFALQIYGDFSGYSDIARGLAKWLGFDFPANFNHPYLASSFRDFWSRWHISLSTWFRDYLYVPLGGSRRGTVAGHVILWVTLLVSALWHGAAWTFVGWGVLHAAYLSIERATNWPKKLAQVPGGRHLSTALVLMMVVVAWVPFRAHSFAQTWSILSTMLNLTNLNIGAVRELIHWRDLLPVAVMVVHHLYVYVGLDRIRMPEWRFHPVLQPAVLAAAVWACVFLRGPGEAFIYFQF